MLLTSRTVLPARVAFLLAALLAVPVLGPSPAAAQETGQDRLDELAAQLGERRVVVAPSMASGDTAAAEALLAADLDAFDFPVFVLVTQFLPEDGLPEDNRDLAALLHDRVGVDGLYVVLSDGDIPAAEVLGLGPDVVDPDLLYRDTSGSRSLTCAVETGSTLCAAQVRRLSHVGEAHAFLRLAALPESAVEDEVDVVVQEILEAPVATTALPDYLTGDAEGEDNSAAGFLGCAAALLTARLLSWRAARRVAPPAPRRPWSQRWLDAPSPPRLYRSVPTHAEVLARAEAAVLALEHALESSLERARTEQGRTAARAARALLTSPDVGDLVGSLVLAEDGRAWLRDQVRTRCFLNPLHGSSAAQVPLQGRAGGLDVPVCAPCRRDLGNDKPGDVLVLARRGRFGRSRDVAYYERDDFWATSGFGALTEVTAVRRRAGAVPMSVGVLAEAVLRRRDLGHQRPRVPR